MDSNAAGSRDEGASDEKIAAVYRYKTSGLFSPPERVALELADAMTQTPPDVSDDLFTRLASYYSEAELVELAAIISQENFRARFNTTFRIQSEGFYAAAESSGGE
jgi:alkylhydroperoxidase family enzyme